MKQFGIIAIIAVVAVIIAGLFLIPVDTYELQAENEIPVSESVSEISTAAEVSTDLIAESVQASDFSADETTSETEETTATSAEAVPTTEAAITEAATETEIVLSVSNTPADSWEEISYYFRSDELYYSHYEKHKDEFEPLYGDISQQEYLEYANRLINSQDGNILHKTEAEDGDFLYFDPDTNEFLVLSTDGYIRTYFIPSAGIDYWERQ